MVLPALVMSAIAGVFIMYLRNKLMKAPTGKDLVESTKGGDGPPKGEQLDKLSKQIKVSELIWLQESAHSRVRRLTLSIQNAIGRSRSISQRRI